MAAVAITELKAHLAKYLRMAQRGVEVLVLDRGVPVARLVGMPEASSSEEAGLERLVRAGIVRRGDGKVKSLVRRRVQHAAGLLQALDEDRADRV